MWNHDVSNFPPDNGNMAGIIEFILSSRHYSKCLAYKNAKCFV